MSGVARAIVAAALAAVAISMYAASGKTPAPAPAPGGELSLRGLFVGSAAAEDAAVVAALTREIADEIEWDGQQEKPLMSAGVHFDALRTRAREFRVRGDSIGSRQTKVRDAVQSYLEKKVGVSGGPVTPEQRQVWVDAYREVGRAAEDAIR